MRHYGDKGTRFYNYYTHYHNELAGVTMPLNVIAGTVHHFSVRSACLNYPLLCEILTAHHRLLHALKARVTK